MGNCFKIWLYSVSFIVFSSLPAIGQISIIDQPVTIDVSNAPLKDFLALVEGQLADGSFAYNPKAIPVEALISYQARQEPLSSLLNFLSEKFLLRYQVVEQQIVLSVQADNPLRFTLSGFITDKETGETLIGATILIDSLNKGTITNGYGHFNLVLPYGKHHITASYLGYQNSEQIVDFVTDVNLSIAMEPSSEQLKEIVVESKGQYFIEEIQTGKASIPPLRIKEQPTAFGEFDVIKSLETIPGIIFQSDGSTFFSVRGGQKDQNLVLIDDAPIYNPTHLLGLYSSIVPDAVNSIDVYRSDFPLAKGGRLSSVIDIKTKEGNKNKFSGWGNIGLVSTQLGLEGPFKQGKHSYILSGRLSRIKWLVKQENPNIEKFQFYDFTGKMNFQLNERNRLYLSFYTGSDEFLDRSSGLGWTNINGSIRWNSLIKKNSFMNLTIYGSNYEYLLYFNRENDERWRSRIGELGIKTDFNTFFKDNQEVSYGFSVVGRTINPGNVVTGNSVPEELIVSVKNNLELIGYLEHKISFNNFGLKYGVRSTLWGNIGEAFEFNFNEFGQAVDTTNYEPGQMYRVNFQLEPRLTLSYVLTKNSSIKGSFSRAVQNLHLISNTISPFTSFEVWLPSGPNIKPQLSDQFSLAYYHSLSQIGVDLRLEGFYKLMQNQIDFTNHASTLLNPTFESELLFGQIRAVGVEVQAKKDAGRLRSTVSYSYSKARSLFGQINNGLTYNSNFDKPHQANFSIQYDITERVMIGANFIFTSGLPFSSPTSFYRFDDNEIPIYARKNNSRFPNYHRLDLNARFILNKNLHNPYQHSISISLFNLYSRKNPIFINFNKSQSEDQFYIATNLLEASRLSSQTYLYRLTPSINYQFKF